MNAVLKACCETAPAKARGGLAARTVEQLFIDACRLDVSCFKPGNVSMESPGHGMQAKDFISSAQAAAAPICNAGGSVGARIFGAVLATQRAVGCNTNLGIVLLAAPLLHAHAGRVPGGGLRCALARTLAGLDRTDAALAYRAIRLANPGGLGTSARHDVHEEPDVTLLEAMRESATRDSIAHQYASDFSGIWNLGLPTLYRARDRWGTAEAEVVTVYLGFVAAWADSHVLRKHGPEQAATVQREGAACLAAVEQSGNWNAARPLLEAFDRSLKWRGLNPGTSADLTVAVLLAAELQELGTPAPQLDVDGVHEGSGYDQSMG